MNLTVVVAQELRTCREQPSGPERDERLAEPGTGLAHDPRPAQRGGGRHVLNDALPNDRPA